MTVRASDYMDDLVDFGYAMKIDYMGTVKETKQLLASQENFRLKTIVPDMITVSVDQSTTLLTPCLLCLCNRQKCSHYVHIASYHMQHTKW